jgi:drug/metabolite transporter (DMT)-like permease
MTAEHPQRAPTPTTVAGMWSLLGAAALWGFGFYAQRVSIESSTPLWATAQRFACAAPLALVALWWSARRGRHVPWIKGTVLGAFLYVAFAFQTIALAYTSTMRVALITGLYAVFVPILQPLFGLRRPSPSQWLAVVLACVGVSLLCNIDFGATSKLPLNIGDALTLAMAVVSAFYVLFAGRYAKDVDALSLNALLVVMMVLAIVTATVVQPEHAHLDLSDRGVWSMLYLAIFSTFVAFGLQLHGQRVVGPATASILMLMETPIGVLAAMVLLGEQMDALQWLGAAVMIVAVAIAVRAETKSSA